MLETCLLCEVLASELNGEVACEDCNEFVEGLNKGLEKRRLKVDMEVIFAECRKGMGLEVS
jgi:hypothetical protein